MPQPAPDRRHRRGPKPKPTAELRTHCVSVRLSAAELEQLDQRRGVLQRGEWLRVAALDVLPPSIPELNRDAWEALARSASNLNQLAHRANVGEAPELGEVLVELRTFRTALIGARLRPQP